MRQVHSSVLIAVEQAETPNVGYKQACLLSCHWCDSCSHRQYFFCWLLKSILVYLKKIYNTHYSLLGE
jgi:hypothetical protein